MVWVKGQSGNPSGRAKDDVGLRRIARENTEEAVKALVYWMKQRKNAKASVAAAQAILDRGYGRPHQTIAGDPDNPLINTIKVLLVGTSNQDT